MRGIRTLPTAPQTSVLRGVVVAIAVLQSVVLGLLARRGSWLSDDLDFLVQGGRGFAPAELLTPVNDHIAPGLRFVYAVFAAVAPLDHDFTVGWRVVMQAIAIVLMGLLLLRILGLELVGRRRHALLRPHAAEHAVVHVTVERRQQPVRPRLRPAVAARNHRLVRRPPPASHCLRPPYRC